MNDFTRTEKRKPDLLCIGAQKAGTTWLHYKLSDHPRIWVPPFKEPHFFDHKFVQGNRAWTGWHIDEAVCKLRKEHLEKDVVLDRDFLLYLERVQSPNLERVQNPTRFNKEWYEDIFAPAAPDQIALDVTPEYSCINEKGINFVKRYLPDAKFIYIIRDPLERACSQIRMFLALRLALRKELPESLEDWKKCLSEMSLYEKADYASYVPLWQKKMKNQITFFPFKDLVERPEQFLRDIEEFVGLEPHDYSMAFNVNHASDKRILIPEEIIEEISEEMQRQKEFLIKFFGQDFASRC